MLTGASRRRLPREVSRSLQPAFEQLQLPWLCPALYHASTVRARSVSQNRTTTTATSRRPLGPLRARTSPAASLPDLQQGRKYANAASTSQYVSSDDFYIPVVSDLGVQRSPWANLSADVPAFDPSDPLVIGENYFQKKDFSIMYNKLNHSDLQDFHTTLEACLTVGMYDRAAATMRYLNKCLKPDTPELVGINNFYIGHMLGLHINTGNPDLLPAISKWYHVDMIKQGIRPDAATYALMIQTVIRDADRGRAGRSVRRFAHAALSDGLLEIVREELANAVPAAEYKQIAEMAPGVFDPALVMARDEIQVVQPAEADQPMNTAEELEFVWNNGLPEALPTQQKGLGLEILRKGLSSLQAQNVVPEGRSTAASNSILRRRQEKLEDDANQSALERWQSLMDSSHQRGEVHPSLNTRGMKDLVQRWHTDLTPLIKDTFWKDEDITGARLLKADLANAIPFVRLLQPELISFVAITSVMSGLAWNRHGEVNNTVAQFVIQIGKAIEMESAKQWVQARTMNRFTKAASKRPNATSARQIYRRAGKFIPEDLAPPEWSKILRVKVGAAVLEHLLKVAALPPDPTAQAGTPEASVRPAVTQKIEFRRGRRRGILVPDRELERALSQSPAAVVFTKQLPMLVPPEPWTGLRQGGYLRGGESVVRLGTPLFQSSEYIRAATKNGDMKQVLKGLDVLGRVPWKINHDVLKVMLQVWNTGEQFGKIPALNPSVDLPTPPPPGCTKREFIEYKSRLREAQDEVAGMHSNRCFINFQLETARSYAKETFYFPHNLDFRGRAYPIPPYLNQMGADHCRGILLFGKGKELGTGGLKWLKIHLANLYGNDKISLKEREAFTEEHLDDIIDSANDPLGGRQWWRQAEDPWQCLACCIELKKALESPDPHKFVSFLPVHQDGTCNGLQHYAALGGDKIGAQQVNLEPGDRPSDIYSAVASHVKDAVTADAAAGDQLATLLQGKIVRKVVKQTVMTNVYGVTFNGALGQINRQLQDLYPDLFNSARRAHEYYLASSYLAKKVFEALGSIFNGASAIQTWLNECADGICRSVHPEQIEMVQRELAHLESETGTTELSTEKEKELQKKYEALLDHLAFKSTVIWTTPLRMPVVQPYRKQSIKRIKTGVQDISIDNPTGEVQVSKKKQLQAFPPNFIHSLDATHMLLSAIRCEEVGLTFSAVHDSFWTHASDIDTMNVILRDAFVRMHREDIVTRLASEFRTRYKGHMRQMQIHRHSILGQKILDWRKDYAASMRKKQDGRRLQISEFVLEVERQRLLNSEDPELQQQGRMMITPASLWAEATADELTDQKVYSERYQKLMMELRKPAADLQLMLDSEHEPSSEVEMSVEESHEPDSNEADILTDSELGQYSEPFIKFKPSATKRYLYKQYCKLWAPLTIPPVPKKGSWDVTRLKESKYFFS